MADKQASKKKTTVTSVQPAKKQEENEDHCRGYPKEYFIVNLVNPLYTADPVLNPYILTEDQMSFIYIHYPDYAKNPIPMIFWLYETALF
jgi:hypothetical protein